MSLEKFLAVANGFKRNGSGDEYYSNDETAVEVVDVDKHGRVELAFDDPKGVRHYLKFSLASLIDVVTKYGREDE